MLSTQHDDDSPYPRRLAAWIDLDYFRRLRPLRGARIWVTLTAVLVSGMYAGWTMLPAHHAEHEAAPVARAHALFNNDCARCHNERWQPLARLVHGDGIRSVADQTCLECHDGAPHQKGQAHAAHCAVCHPEHRGKVLLARVGDGHCTDCHASLHEKEPKAGFRDVSSFDRDHPEFRALGGQKDEAKLHFNHAAHLDLDLAALRRRGTPGLEGLGDRLDCASCHRPDSERRYMEPIRYEAHCARCHPLTVQISGDLRDPQARAAAERFQREPAPHQEPSVVRAVLRERLLDFVQQNPVLSDEMSPQPQRPLPGRGPRPVSEAQARWVKGQLGAAEQWLFVNRQLPGTERGLVAGTCRLCHVEAAQAKEGAFELLPTKVPGRWFSHSVFRHDSHRMLDCLACHAGAARSRLTTDVLMPSIESCRQCHQPGGGARSDCAECHTYHQRSLERTFRGPFTIDRFLTGR
jgi:hypothetical protein